jgi:hypothetical protein
MITVYECTDCPFCAEFGGEYWILCMHPKFPPEEVEKYKPVGDEDAIKCEYFAMGDPVQLTDDDFKEATIDLTGDEEGANIYYTTARNWVENNKLSGPMIDSRIQKEES